jgi:3-dehydroquinate dehydratase-1
MRPIIIREVTIGEGFPKICVSITENSRDKILEKGRRIVESSADIVEWRVDWFDFTSFEEVIEILGELRLIIEEMPLIFTFRNCEEGGKKTLNLPEYILLLAEVTLTRNADIIDVEVFKAGLLDTNYLEEMIGLAKKYGVKLLASNHDFTGTPPTETMFSTLRAMSRLKVDMVKIAVMSRTMGDVISLLTASEMYEEWEESLPFIAISMGELGRISRYCGEKTGSVITFGALGEESAPGQIPVDELRDLLIEHHEFSR